MRRFYELFTLLLACLLLLPIVGHFSNLAITALNNGARLEDVQKMLGHADIRTTQIYDRRKHQHKDSAVFAVK